MGAGRSGGGLKKGTVPFLAAVEAALARLVPGWPEARLCVALSGGVDSVALLAACVELRVPHPTLRLRAIHVHHGLQSEADDWQARCEELCERLQVPLEVVRLALAPRRGESVEAEARDARYAALVERLAPGEALLTAHHEDDQLETVLLQLFRGAGVAGLAAMPAVTIFGGGLHVRPLLGLTRGAIAAWALEQGLDWVEDPMNASARFDRAFLRQQLTPALRNRWPAVARTVARAAGHLAEARGLLEDLAAIDGEPLLDEEGRLAVAGLMGLPRARQANMLRWWIRLQGLGAPSSARLGAIIDDVIPARGDAQPVVTWQTGEVRRYRGRLYAMRPLLSPDSGPWPIVVGQRLAIPGLGTVTLRTALGKGIAQARFAGPYEIRLRRGGDRLRPVGRARPVALEELFRLAHIEPWIRDRTPLVIGSGQLLAVGERWVAVAAAAAPAESGLVVAWESESL